MSSQPFMPLFFGDLLAATPTWEGEERALYMLLLAYQWTSGPLPADPKRLAKMTQYDAKTFAALWGTVGKKFDETPDGLVNQRLEAHREKSKAISAKNSASGAKGAKARWGNDGERHSERHSENDGERHQSANGVTHSNPSHPIPSHPRDQKQDSETARLDTGGGARRAASADGEIKPEGRMATALRDKGVAVTSQHPTLLAWLRDGFTTEQAVEAVGIARIRKPHPEAIPAAYLDRILREPQTPATPRPLSSKFDRAMEELSRA